MDWRSHVLIGALSAGAVLYLLGHAGAAELVPLVVFGALSSLLPDLDYCESKARRMLDYAVVALAFTAVWLAGCGGSACVPSLSWAIPAFVISLAAIGAYFLLFMFFKPQHRGITHTMAACATFGIGLYILIGPMPALAGSAGYLSHLLADREIKII